MSDPVHHLRPADPDAVLEALSYALRFEGRPRVHHADVFMSRVTAGRLLEHLKAAGFVV